MHYSTYYPFKTGSTVVWDVDSIAHDSFKGTVDTFRFQVKDTVVSPYTDNEGRPGLIIERYIRTSDTGQWQIFRVYYVIFGSSGLIEVYDNIPVLRLISPVKEGGKWDGNAFNSRDPEEFRYISTSIDTSINGYSFTGCLMVQEGSLRNPVEIHEGARIYAPSVGPVFIKEVNMQQVYTPSGNFMDGYERYMRIRKWRAGV